MKKLLVFVFVMFLLVGTVSAWEWDNKKYYDEETETVTFKNSFLGLIPTDTFAVARLNTPRVNQVFRGQNRRVMEFEIELYLDDYDNFLKEFEIYDFNSEGYIDTDYRWEVAVYGQKEVWEVVNTCGTYSEGKEVYGNSVDCIGERKLMGYEYGIVRWEQLNLAKLSRGNHTISLVKDVAEGEHMDGIPTLFGKRVDEWAVWEDVLNNELIAYWDFDQGADNLTDQVAGEHNLTPSGDVIQGLNGLIINATFFNGAGAGDSNASTPGVPSLGIRNGTWAGWVNLTSNTTDDQYLLIKTATDGANQNYAIRYDTCCGWRVLIGDGSGVATAAGGFQEANAAFHHVAMRWNSTYLDVWLDGVQVASAVHALTVILNTAPLTLGENRPDGFGVDLRGMVDEAGLWNRTLTDGEIVQLFNNGTGLDRDAPVPDTGVESGLSLVLDSPLNNTLNSSTDWHFESTLTPVELNLTNATITVWYVNSTVFNMTQNVVTGNETNTTSWDISGFPEGIFLWGVEGCGVNLTDHICNMSTNNFTFEVDFSDFPVLIDAPSGVIDQAQAGGNLSLNWTITEPSLDSCIFEYAGINTTLVCADNNFSFSLVAGFQSIILTANDTAGNSAFNTTSWVYTLFNNNVSLNSTALDTQFQSFIINVTYDSGLWTSIITSLVYNGTSFTTTRIGSGDEALFTRGLDIPIVRDRSNLSFNWEFTLSNSTDTSIFNSNTFFQDVSPTNMSLCGSPLATSGLNFSVFDEIDPSKAINVSAFANSLNWFLGTGTVKKNISFSNTNVFNVEMCISHNETFHTENRIQLVEPGYDNRLYELIFVDVTNVTTNFDLFMLNESFASNIIIEVKDAGLVPFEGVTTEIRRFYPVDNEYRLVETQITDHFGQFVASLVENDVRYKFRFLDSNGVQLKETGDVVIACRSSICVIPFVIEDTTNDFERFQNITGFDWTLSFDNGTNTFLYSWADTTGETHTKRLLVERKAFNGSAIICNSTSTAATGSLSCGVGDADAQYTAQIFRDSAHRRLSVLSVFVGSSYKDFGLEGLIWTFFLTMTMIAVGIFWPPAGIVLYILGIFVLGVGNIIYISAPLIIAQIVIGVLFIWAIRT